MWALATLHRDEFLRMYHKRSNSETAFHMLKAKFGGRVRSKTFRAQVNEVLLKCLLHNLCRVNHAFYELGIDPVFEAESAVASENKRFSA